MPVTFSEVKQILDEAVATWKSAHGREPNLEAVHADGNFGWETREQLLQSKPFGQFQLIDPELIGNDRGHETNLIIALTNPTGVQFLGQMPPDIPAEDRLPQEKIDKIIEWINDGAPGDEERVAPEKQMGK